MIRVISYNVWGLPGFLATLPSRFDEIIKSLTTLSADIILLQECFHKDTDRFETLLSHKFRGPDSSCFSFRSGLLSLSNDQIIKSKNRIWSNCQGWDCFSNKGISLIYSHNTYFINVHFNSDGNDDESRQKQLDELLKFISINTSDKDRIVLAGDFNFSPESFLYQKILNSGFIDLGPGEPTYDSIKNNWVEDGRRRIDYIFGRNISLNSSALFGMKKIDNKNMSDHFGIITVID